VMTSDGLLQHCPRRGDPLWPPCFAHPGASDRIAATVGAVEGEAEGVRRPSRGTKVALHHLAVNLSY